MSNNIENGFPSPIASYGMFYGRYVNSVINSAIFKGRYRDGAYPVNITDLLDTLKTLFDRGVGTNLYKNPVRFLDKLEKQGTPCSYFSHPNTLNHLWSGPKTTTGDLEVLEIDYNNFVDPTIPMVEKWKAQTQAVTGIKANSIDMLVTNIGHALFARATYLVSGHLQKFEICLPGNVWHDVTFNYGIIDHLPVFTDFTTKADADFFSAFKMPIDPEGGTQFISVDPESDAVIKASEHYKKLMNKTFTLYGTLDATDTSVSFMFVSAKYSATDLVLKNPITTSFNSTACIAMEQFDQVKDKEIFDKLYGNKIISRHLCFKVIDSPDMAPHLFEDYVERKEFLKELPKYGFISYVSNGYSAQVVKSYRPESIGSHCSFVAPNTMLFGSVIDTKDSIKVIDTSINVVSKILDTFVIPRGLTNRQKPEQYTEEVKQFLADNSGLFLQFPDLPGGAAPTTNKQGDPLGAFDMYQITQNQHTEERFRNKSIRYSTGALLSDVVRHYPLTNANVSVQLAVQPYGAKLPDIYEAAFSTSMDYDRYEYTVLPETDGTYLHGALTPQTKCICGRTIEDHIQQSCEFSEGEWKLSSYRSNNVVAIHFLTNLRDEITKGNTKFNNIVEINFLWLETALSYLLDIRTAALIDPKVAAVVKEIFMLASDLTLPSICIYGEIEELKAFTRQKDEPIVYDSFRSLMSKEDEIPDVESIFSMTKRKLGEYLKASKKTKPLLLGDKIIATSDNYEFIVYLLKYVRGVRISQFFTKEASFKSGNMLNDSKLREAIMATITHPLNVLQAGARFGVIYDLLCQSQAEGDLTIKALELIYGELDKCIYNPLITQEV